jgi:hypothetical protein
MNRAATFSTLLVAVCTTASWGQTPLEELAAKIPASANAVVLVDAERLLASPLATKENWKGRYEKAFASGSVTMTPDTRQLVLGAQIEYETMQPRWVVAVAELGKPRSAAEVARATKGVLDPFGETPAVALRENAYAIDLGRNFYAAMSPADRQSIARWLREIRNRTKPALTAFLNDALKAAKNSPMIMAFDLEDAIPADVVSTKLASSDALKAKQVDPVSAARILQGVRGVVLEVAVTDGTYSRLVIYFRDDPALLVPIAKPLIQDVMAGLGAAMDDVDAWTTQSGPRWIAVHGPLSAAGRKRLFALVDNPLNALLAEEPSQSASADREKSKAAAASLQHFHAIESIVEEVRNESKKSVTFGQNALWFDRWAKRIDALPVLNVDPDLLKFSEYLSTQLRNMAAAMRGIGIRSGARTAQIWGATSVYYSGYSYYADSRNADPERRAMRAQEKAQGTGTAREIAREVENALAKVRKDLTKKYQVEF